MVTDPRQRLEGLATAGLLHAPTPLQPLPRLSSVTGTDWWIKRDDVGPVALAGNKLRKFDVVLGQALHEGADLLITTGAAQSNSARAGAAAAARLGLECRLLLAGPAPTEATANILLDQLLGADISYLPDAGWPQLEDAVETAAEVARAAGRKPVVAPVGCSSPLGALGFALAYLELRAQCDELDFQEVTIVHASSSLGTHAGLLIGRALLGEATPIVGIDVAAIADDQDGAATVLAQQAATLIGLELPDPGARIETGFLGPGYGVPDAATAAAIDLFARTEAVITDPVYSGKGAAGALALASQFDGPVVFWHTGGYHALFDPPHAAALAAARRRT